MTDPRRFRMSNRSNDLPRPLRDLAAAAAAVLVAALLLSPAPLPSQEAPQVTPDEVGEVGQSLQQAPRQDLRQDPRPQDRQFEGRVDVSEVLLDVLVTDRRGNVVLGLSEDDFVVEEDGEPVEISDVTFYSNRQFLDSPERAAELGIDSADVRPDRYFILFFHDQRDVVPRITAQLLDAGRRSKQWVETELLSTDYVAVVGYDYDLDIFQDFTTDKERIARAIDEAVQGREPESWPSRQDRTGGPSLIANLPDARTLERATTRFYGGLRELSEAAGYIDGRKNVVLFSIGFGDVSPFGIYTPDSRYYPPMMQSLNDNNVAVYSIDLISIDPNSNVLENVYGSSLSQLSTDTGGQYYFTGFNFLGPLEKVSEDNGGYYLISYRSPHPEGESGYQRVQVRTVNREFETRAREGYLYGPAH
jgi:VWFA-related protein